MKRTIVASALASVALAGCGGGPISVDPGAATGQAKGPKFTGPNVPAGLPVPDTAADPTQFTKLVASSAGKFHPRSDPFALSPEEKSFDISQASERVFTDIGGFPTYVTPVETVAPEVAVEPQPYRRLSGIVVGDSVVAIIDMGNGSDPEIIRPGQKVPHHEEWTVVSLDQNRAILRRDGNVLPKEIQVRLETPPAEYAPAVNTPPPMGGPGGPGGMGGRFGRGPGPMGPGGGGDQGNGGAAGD